MSLVQTPLPPLAIPTKTRSTGPIVYPTTPLSVFPPPAPSVLRSMRDHRRVSLTLQIDTPFKASPGPWSPKGHIQPYRSHLPRRRNPKPCFQNFHAIAEPGAPKPKPKPAPTPTPTPKTGLVPTWATSTPIPAIPTPRPPKADEPHLQAIIPAVWVAFSDTAAASRRAHEEGFTHVVEIAHSGGEPYAAGSIERRWDAARQAQRLRLILPEQAGRGGRAALSLTDGQLRAARDFVGECLPRELAAMPEQDAVRVLVTAPPGRPTDAMCLVGCYLGFVAGRGVEEVLRCIDEEESILSVWKGEVSGEEVERADEIAKGWSWLTVAAVRT
ncbi:hypothetical protein LXA43DRAFT_1095466 [Ganoderma leucocontextum]|nr:hypothetical protein LXA43DRAFT_1095466 [Ganoderma leucocontextum]